jgi:hypothetical protein
LIEAPCADSLLLVQEIRSMMGERRMMQALFYGFSLERHVPDGHLLPKIDGSSTSSHERTIGEHLRPHFRCETE